MYNSQIYISTSFWNSANISQCVVSWVFWYIISLPGVKRGKKTWWNVFDQCPQLVFDSGKYAESVCVSFLLWSSHFFLTNGGSQARGGRTWNRTHMQCSKPLWHAGSSNLYLTNQTTGENNNDNFKNNKNNISDTEWYWKLQPNRIFILTLYCIKFTLPFSFCKVLTVGIWFVSTFEIEFVQNTDVWFVSVLQCFSDYWLPLLAFCRNCFLPCLPLWRASPLVWGGTM